MIRSFEGAHPALHPTARVAENAVLVGQVALEGNSSVWYSAVVRGDRAPIRVGEGSNLQDAVVVHCGPKHPVDIGRDVTVGHGAILHGCTVEDGCLIGMGAILLNGCLIGAGSLVAAGALVTQNMEVPPGSMVMGSPAKVTRSLRPEELEQITASAETYRRLSAELLPACGGGTMEEAP